MPPAGGVNPAGRSAGKIAEALRDSDPQTQGAIATALELYSGAAKDVGLTVTVNDLPRVVMYMKKSYEEGASGEPGKSVYPPVYKGVSFNPSTFDGTRREWVMLLDFFALMRSLAKRCNEAGFVPPQFAVQDASLYWVVNLIGGNVKVRGTAEEAARQLVGTFIEAAGSEEYSDVYETARTRNAYMRSICSEFPAAMAPPVFTLFDIWKDPKFVPLLAQAMELLCAEDRDGTWRVNKAVRYDRYMPYSPWVTPLVAAEVSLMGREYGFRASLSPTSEAVWNEPMDHVCRSTKTPPYVVWAYVRNIGTQLPYADVPFFSDPKEEFFRKMDSPRAKAAGLTQLVQRLVGPFAGEDVDLDRAYSWCAKIDRKTAATLKTEERMPELRLDTMGWLLAFPPGTC